MCYVARTMSNVNVGRVSTTHCFNNFVLVSGAHDMECLQTPSHLREVPVYRGVQVVSVLRLPSADSSFERYLDLYEKRQPPPLLSTPERPA